MAKSKKKKTEVARKVRRTWDPEQKRWFVPVAFVLILVSLLVLFGDFIFSDQMLYGSDTIQAGVFFRSFLVDYYNEHGSVPQWNPYIFAGMPYVEAFHGDIFYPLSVLKFFGSIYRMLGMTLVLHIFLAGLFMYLAARQFRLSKTAALMSAVCYMFAGYLVSLVAPGHDGKIYVTALFPLVMLFLDRMFQRRAFLNASLLGLVLGVVIVSPHPQMSYFTLWAVALYTLYRLYLLFRERKQVLPLVRPALLSVYAVVIGLLISAIQFYPGYIYTSDFSPRADTKKGWSWATSWSMHAEEAFSLVIPEFSGTSSKNTRTYYWGKNSFKDNSESVGVVAFFVGLLGLLISRRRVRWFMGGLALFALLYALGGSTPVFQIFYFLIPKVKALRAPSMIMFLFSFSVAMLAGMAVQRLIDARSESRSFGGRRFHYFLWVWPAAMLVLALLFGVAGRSILSAWASIFHSQAATTYIQQGVTRLDVAYRNLPAIQSGAWLAFLFTAVAALLIWLYMNRKAGMVLLVGLTALPVLDGVRFDSRFISTFDQDQMWAPNPVTEFFRQQPGQYRVMSQMRTLPFHGVQLVTGYHGNQLRWYDELLGGPGAPGKSNPRLLNLVGTRYLVIPSDQQISPTALGRIPLAVAADLGSMQIIENDNAFPRVFLADEYRVFTDRGELVDEVIRGSLDLRRVVCLEREPGISVVADSLYDVSDSAWIVDYAIDSVVVGLVCSRNQLLVLTDNYYDAWQVTIDGAPAELLRSYGSFRAVAVPAGSRQVLFNYDSQRYKTGRLVTGLTLMYVLVIIGVNLVRSKSRRKPEDSKD